MAVKVASTFICFSKLIWMCFLDKAHPLTRRLDSFSAATMNDMSLVSFFIFLKEAITPIGTENREFLSGMRWHLKNAWSSQKNCHMILELQELYGKKSTYITTLRSSTWLWDQSLGSHGKYDENFTPFWKT